MLKNTIRVLMSVAGLLAIVNANAAALRSAKLQPSEGVSVARREHVTAAPSAPRWKASVDSYYYNFEGTHAANNDLYDFEDSELLMQLFIVQYQVSPRLSVMALGQYLDNYVETRMFGTMFRDRTRGYGDTIVSLVPTIYASSNFVLVSDAGVSLPTGSIDEKNRYNDQLNYPYNMQNGSGTVDGVLGITPVYFNGPINTGGRLSTFQRMGRNTNGYRLGDLYRADAWFNYNVGAGFIPRLVGYYKHKESIEGQDNTLGRSELTEFYHHTQINWDVSAGLRYQRSLGPVTFWLEGGVPLAQDSRNRDNVVVSTDFYGNASVSGAF
jgi:hypothetical protein